MSDESVFVRLEAAGRQPRRIALRGAPTGEATDTCGPYEVLGRLAQGGVGEVWRGRDADIGRDVALKVLRAGHVDNAEMVQRFLDEAQIAGQLQHPGVVPVYELGLRPDRRPFIAMKLVKGKTLAALLRDGDVPRRRMLKTFEQVCRTLAYAHERGVVHRDLKPSNVMVGPFGEVQVLDWGFAKILPRGGVADERRHDDLTRIATSGAGTDSVAGSVMGTPAYMPPEQALGEVDELDERSDVFSLGAILCEILTGSPPYVGDDLIRQAAQARLDDAFARLDACGADDDVADLARRCLSPLRADRPSNAREVGDAILEHLAAVEERAHRATVAAARTAADAERARLDAREQLRARRQSLVLAVCFLLALVVAGGSYAAVDARMQGRLRRTARAADNAITEAQGHRGRGAWAEARAAAERAATLARDGDDTLRKRAARTLARIRAEERAALERAEQAGRERRLLAELDEIRLERAEDFGTEARTDASLSTALAARGIDVTAPDAAAAAINARWSGIREELASVLDDWAALRREIGRESAGMERVARVIDPDPWRVRLRDALATGDADALRALREEAEGRPDLSVRTLGLLAAALETRGREAAIALARRAWRADPTDFWTTIRLARWLAVDHPGEALRFSEAAVALRPRSAYAWHNLAHACWVNGRLERADGLFRKSMRLAPRTAQHHACYCLLLSSRGDHDRAVEVARRAVRLDPNYAGAHYKLARVLHAKGDDADALAAAREAVRLKPDHGRAHALIGALLQLRGDLDGATRVLREAARHEPENADLQLGLGSALQAKGDLHGAVTAYREAVRLRPRYAAAYNSLGFVLNELGDVEGALRACREAIRIDPGQAAFFVTLAGALIGKNDAEGVVEASRNAIRLDPGLPSAHVNLGTGLSMKGDHQEGVAALREAIRLQPDFAKAYYGLGNIYMIEIGDMRSAEKALRDAIRVRPEYAEAHCNLANALRQQGRFQEALEMVRRGHELGSRQPYWRYDSAAWVRSGEKLAEYERRLPEFVAGTRLPRDVEETRTIGWMLYVKQRYADSAATYGSALDRWPTAWPHVCYPGAVSAVLAGTPEWRARALGWLRMIFDNTRSAPIDQRRPMLAEIKGNPHLAAFRDRLGELPESEQPAWRKFWADVDAVLAVAK